jgi:hypothetical protein
MTGVFTYQYAILVQDIFPHEVFLFPHEVCWSLYSHNIADRVGHLQCLPRNEHRELFIQVCIYCCSIVVVSLVNVSRFNVWLLTPISTIL